MGRTCFCCRKRISLAQAAGAGAVAMHGQTRVQMYEGKANWEVLKEVKKHLTIPFMGNGDVKTPEDAKRMLEYVGADGVMIGRAALGNPWMIHRTQHYLETGELIPEPTAREKIATAKLHLERLVDFGSIACREFRTSASYYLKGISRAAKIKLAINKTEKQHEINELLDQLVEKSEKLSLQSSEVILSFLRNSSRNTKFGLLFLRFIGIIRKRMRSNGGSFVTRGTTKSIRRFKRSNDCSS